MTTILTDNTHYTDIASAIRSKAGVQDLFKPSEMAAAILSIPTGGSAVLGSKSITQNGTYYASADSLDGYSYVDVNVQGGSGNEDAIIDGTIVQLINSTALSVASSKFANCAGLLSVSMAACTTIGGYGFDMCVNLADASFPECTNIGASAFHGDSNLANAYFPKCVNVGSYAFMGCHVLSGIDMPECTAIRQAAFNDCINLSIASLSKCQIIGANAFVSCKSLTAISLPKCSEIGSSAFKNCFNLISFDLTGVESVPNLAALNAFASTPVYNYNVSAGQYGSIYVPASLYNAFITAPNWSNASLVARMVSV